jgi:hypothetical protein
MNGARAIAGSVRCQLNDWLDAIYVTASARDARQTRICVASIRHFYPDAPIRLLVGGILEPGLADELARYWDVTLADVPPGEWGWGFVKLEPLFGPPGERFLVVDSDTVFVGPVLQAWAECAGQFMVDDEEQSEADTHRLYYDWRQVVDVDPSALAPQFVFNSGQWFGTAGVLTRADFIAYIDWSVMPPRLRHTGLFKNGDQGLFNYVLNQKAQIAGLAVMRHKLMRWPGHGMAGLGLDIVRAGKAPPLIVHWAGYKSGRLSSLPGSELLRYFEQRYYDRLPGGFAKRAWRRVRYPMQFMLRKFADKVAFFADRSG